MQAKNQATLIITLMTLSFTVITSTCHAGLSAPVLKWSRGGCYSSWCETGWYSSPALARSGQFGQIDDYFVLNIGTTYHAKPLNTDFFVSLKNLLDETYIVDRARGILPGSPRLVQAGFKVNF